MSWEEFVGRVESNLLMEKLVVFELKKRHLQGMMAIRHPHCPTSFVVEKTEWNNAYVHWFDKKHKLGLFKDDST